MTLLRIVSSLHMHYTRDLVCLNY